jgi:hypothetical protein
MSDMSLMFSFFSQSSGGNNGSSMERQRSGSEKLKMMSGVKISYHDMIRKGRDLSSNHGSSVKNANNPDNALSVYDFKGAT